ncbi:protein-L-isoaspartate O-methyltransferase [soil metagenome]
MNIEQARLNMIVQQIRPWEVFDQDVLDLLLVVRREDFVPPAFKPLAFADTQIPLQFDDKGDEGESMFSPKIEARILQEIAVRKHENVLEIGAGSGYMAALLGHRARHVTSVEIDPALQAMAERNLADAGIDNVHVVAGDGAQGWAGSGSESAPYDVIVISGSLPRLPEVFLEQIKVGGRIFAIIGEEPAMTAQVITRVSADSYKTTTLFETCVKPLRNALTPPHFKF